MLFFFFLSLNTFENRILSNMKISKQIYINYISSAILMTQLLSITKI